jgi:nucleotidyltransferase AbiEii toxin of type IV toxin-antitoxin system
MANTRMKDFYDLWRLCQDFDFDGALLIDAIKSTFTRRGTEVPGAWEAELASLRLVAAYCQRLYNSRGCLT